MKTEPYKAQGMPWVSPYISVQNVEEAIDFYKRAFQFEPRGEVIKDESGQVIHGELQYKDMVLMLGLQGASDQKAVTPNHSAQESPISLYVYCQDVDLFFKQAVKEGALPLAQPEMTFWGDRMCRLKDPNGYIWAFATCLDQSK